MLVQPWLLFLHRRNLCTPSRGGKSGFRRNLERCVQRDVGTVRCEFGPFTSSVRGTTGSASGCEARCVWHMCRRRHRGGPFSGIVALLLAPNRGQFPATAVRG